MLLADFKAFQGMSSEALARLQQGGTVVEPCDRSEIFLQGDPPDVAYAIIAGDGHVRMGASDRRGRALMVEVFHRGEIFGEIGVIDGLPRTTAAVVEGKVRLLKIPAPAFLAVLASCPSLGDALSHMLAQRLRRTCELFQDATFERVEVRLARQVLYLLGREGKATPSGPRLAHRFRQSDLADLLATSTRSIITVLNAWRAAGLVGYDTERALLTVQDTVALQAVAAGECLPLASLRRSNVSTSRTRQQSTTLPPVAPRRRQNSDPRQAPAA
jgi:CRP-like cAMP-binding protein